MNKKYYLTLTDRNGNVVFSHKSDYAYKLLRMEKKECFSSDGSMMGWAFNAKRETNIPDSVAYRAYCGDKV